MPNSAREADLIVRGGTVYDGSGGQPFIADVAIVGDRIAAIGADLDWTAGEEIDARGRLVTPGFLDIHTHYDGQAIWSERLSPSSAHGVTTVVVGNCGVGFAPCHAEDHERLISVMEGVEDIPQIVMAEGLPWTWESFEDYLDALQNRRHDIDVAAYIPHSPLRVYVMGERGAAREPATPDDLAQMAAIVERAIHAGAIGFSTANIPVHRTSTGDFTPSFRAAEEELQAVAKAIRRAGRGIIQILPDMGDDIAKQVGLMERLSRTSGSTVTFSLGQTDSDPNGWREVLDRVAVANRLPGVSIKAQVFPRPIGMLLGHDVTLNPFRLCPSYDAIADLPLEQKIAELRKPEMREKLLSETPLDPKMPLFLRARNFHRLYELGASPEYEPPVARSIANRAKEEGVTPEALAYDLLLKDDGRALLLNAMANYSDGSLDPSYQMLKDPNCVPGLGDGGAHYGMICDASFPTFMLTHWTRDRAGPRLDIGEVIAALTTKPAEVVGLTDRGRLQVGLKADLNVIDYDDLKVLHPIVRRDLPSGGRRLDQGAKGYIATIVSGKIIQLEDNPTGAMPGKVIRDFASHPGMALG